MQTSLLSQFQRFLGATILLAFLWLTGCCDGMLLVSGRVTDANDGALLDSVDVRLFYIVKREAKIAVSQETDSTGTFSLEEFGCFKSDEFFLLASRPGYISQTIDVEGVQDGVQVQLVRE